MRRRDAVLIAVLVNAGLLVFLFALAVTGPEDSGRGVLMPPGGELVELIPSHSSGDEMHHEETTFVAQHHAPQESTLSFVPTINSVEQEAAPTQQHETLSVGAPTPSRGIYTVKRGDALERIAKQHGVTVASLMKLNALKSSSKISIGQVLQIPAPEVATSKNTATAEEASKGAAQHIAAKFYTVQKGDNVWAIATRHHMKTDELLKMNKMTPEMARRLQPGDRLRVK
jgi:peptidoglycan DL-endopeptidase LytF